MPNEMSFFKYNNVTYDIADEKARQDLAECVNNGYYDSNAKKIILRHNSDIIVQIDATDFIKDGMVSNVQIINGYLVITFNTDSGQEPISIPITDIFNPDNYYNKSATNELLALKQNVIQDLEQIRQGANAGSTAYQKPQGGIPKTDMSDDVKESLDKADGAASKKEVEEHYARKDGYYETFGAGTANNLKSDITTDREIMFDKSGGLNDIDSGSANLSKVQGNTIAWNNFMQNGNFATKDGWNTANATFTISDNTATLTYTKFPSANYDTYISRTVPLTQGHKYCIMASVKASHNGTFRIDTNSAFYNIDIPITEDTWTAIRVISTSTLTSSGRVFTLYPLGKSDGYTVGDSFSVKNVQLFDLTLIYGAGNEPTSVAQFEADYQRRFGKPLTYEPYDAGSLRNVMMSAIKTTGFNQYNPTTGKANVFAGITYYIGGTYSTLTINGDIISPINRKFTPSVNGEVVVSGGDNTTVINVSNDSVNGQYKPYWNSTKSIPVTQLTGKLNGQGESVTIFPDGMKRAGDIRDEIFVDNGVVKAIKRVGAVDLGSVMWNNFGGSGKGNGRYVGIKNLAKRGVDGFHLKSYITSRYIEDSGYNFDERDMPNRFGYRFDLDYLYLQDSNLASKTGTQVAETLDGVMLYYEFKEPQVYVLDDDVLPLMYKVDELGTEQVLPECTEETPCCAPILSVNYAMNAVAQLRNMHTNYISKASLDNLLSLVNSTLVSVLGGTISVNPTQTNDAYTFAFSEVSNMVVFVSNGSQITDVIGNFPPTSYIDNGKAKFYLKHDNALIPLSVAYTGSITAVGVYSPYGSTDTYTVRFGGAYSTSIIGATVNVEQIN